MGIYKLKVKRHLLQACLLCAVMPSLSNSVEAQFTVWTNTDDGTTGIADYTGSGGAVSIRPSMNGYPITSLDGFSGKTNVTSVTMPNTVKYISLKAFEGCTSLTNITIADSVVSIAEYAFWRCSSLSRITIPSSVVKIESGAFEDCTSLTDIAIGSGVTSLGKDAFLGCSNLTSITLPDPNSLADIQDDAFKGCGRLASITIGSNTIYCSNFISTAHINCEIMRMNWSCGRNRRHTLTKTLETLIKGYQLDTNQADTCITIGGFLDKEYRNYGDYYDYYSSPVHSVMIANDEPLNGLRSSFNTSVNRFIKDGRITLNQDYEELAEVDVVDLPFLFYSQNKRKEWEGKANQAGLPDGAEKEIGVSDQTGRIKTVFRHGHLLIMEFGSTIYYDHYEPFSLDGARIADGDSVDAFFDHIASIKYHIKEAEALQPYNYSWNTKEDETEREKAYKQRIDNALR